MWIFVIGAAIVLWLVSWLASGLYRKRVVEFKVPVRDVTKGHHWIIVDAFEHGSYCSQCEMGVLRGLECDFCSIKVDAKCLRMANASIQCRLISDPNRQATRRHHWIHGNLPLLSVCAICEDQCGDGPGLVDFRCAWCQVCLHERCRNSFGSLCDFGKLKRAIMPPNCVVVKSIGWKGRLQLVVDEVIGDPDIGDWAPVIVVANEKSGNGDGEALLGAFRKILNPVQVINVSRVSPKSGLRWCKMLSNVQCRVLIAGGDGTIGWILSTIEELGLCGEEKHQLTPLIGLLPLGTGNDLSRALGWGAGHSGAVDPEKFLHQLDTNTIRVKLDRWSVSIQHRRLMGYRPRDRNLTMSNYLSIGVDACVTYNMHHRRAKLPRAMSSRLVNKFLFFTYGTYDVLEHACRNMQEKVELILDGQRLALPALEGIVLLNIPFWGAGVRVWDLGGNSNETWQTQRIDDGIFEVFGLYSSMHIAQMQVNMSEPLRLGQGKHLSIRVFHGKLPMQMDGEPWLQVGTL